MDIPRAFVHADVEETTHMLLDSEITELLIKLGPNMYRKYIWENKREKPML